MTTVKEKGMQSTQVGLHIEITAHSNRLLHAFLMNQAKLQEQQEVLDQLIDRKPWQSKVIEELDGVYTLCDEPTEKMRSLFFRMSINFCADEDNCVNDLDLVMMQIMFNTFNAL